MRRCAAVRADSMTPSTAAIAVSSSSSRIARATRSAVISTGFASFLVPTATDSVHVLSPAAVMVTVVGAVGVLAFRDGLVVAGAGADSAALGGASVAGRAFRDGRAEFDSSTSVFDDDFGCGFGGAGSGVRRRTAAVAVVAAAGR